jgi:hypothetical protein
MRQAAAEEQAQAAATSGKNSGARRDASSSCGQKELRRVLGWKEWQ